MHEKSKKYKNLALFDFDGTLYKKDSFTGFIFYTHSKKHIIKQGFKILPWIQAYYLKAYPAHAMRPKLFHAMFKNADVATIEKIAEEYAHHITKNYNPELLIRLRDHQSLGDDVVLVSATVDIYLKYVAKNLGVDFICTQTEVFNQHYTGHYSSADCSSKQKALRILEHYNLSQYQHIYAYGNSDEDLAMLNLAHHSYYVGKSTHLPLLEKAKQLA